MWLKIKKSKTKNAKNNSNVPRRCCPLRFRSSLYPRWNCNRYQVWEICCRVGRGAQGSMRDHTTCSARGRYVPKWMCKPRRWWSWYLLRTLHRECSSKQDIDLLKLRWPTRRWTPRALWRLWLPLGENKGAQKVAKGNQKATAGMEKRKQLEQIYAMPQTKRVKSPLCFGRM